MTFESAKEQVVREREKLLVYAIRKSADYNRPLPECLRESAQIMQDVLAGYIGTSEEFHAKRFCNAVSRYLRVLADEYERRVEHYETEEAAVKARVAENTYAMRKQIDP